MDGKWYRKTTLAEMKKMKFVLARAVGNGRGVFPKGLKVVVEDKQAGLTLRADPCTHCGVAVRITKVSPFDVDIDLDG